MPPPFQPAEAPGSPSLTDLWAGTAEFVVDVADTGLPLGESDTHILRDGTWISFVHASYQSAGVVDQCGAPVAFPGCIVTYSSPDGRRFTLDEPVCLFECVQCPCESERDHVDQQQYPDAFYDGATLWLAYEYRGRATLRTSADGRQWSPPQRVAESGIWRRWYRQCGPGETIGPHPFVPYDYECLSGAPPAVYVNDDGVFVFVGVGQNPGGLGCWRGSAEALPAFFERCAHNPLFQGAPAYGPLAAEGDDAAAYFDFRTVSSAELMRIDDRYYMLYEGIRGPAAGDAGDTQFGLGLARSTGDWLDGPWERFPGNPLLLPPPANVGLGHADLIVHDSVTYLYTSLDGETRSRLRLIPQTETPASIEAGAER